MYKNWVGSVQAEQGLIKISVSGECSGSISLKPSTVALTTAYSYTEGSAPELHYYNFSTSSDGGVGLRAHSSVTAAGNKFVETVASGKVKQQMAFTHLFPPEVYLNVLHDPYYDSVLRCKNGEPLRQQTNYLPYMSPVLGAAVTHRATAKLQYTQGEARADAVMKQQYSGLLVAAKASCANKGDLSSDKYVFNCQSAKPIKVKISVNVRSRVELML